MFSNNHKLLLSIITFTLFIATSTASTTTLSSLAWRNDGQCGASHQAPNGNYPSECNPSGVNPCCSSGGWCGGTNLHCQCVGCIDYRLGSGSTTSAVPVSSTGSGSTTSAVAVSSTAGNLPTTLATLGCQSGWTFYEPEKTCISVESTSLVNWATAKDNCNNHTDGLANLTIIDNSDKQSTIASLVRDDTDYWIGLNDIAVEGEFKWLDGTPVGFENWKPGKPSSGGAGSTRDCAAIWSNQDYQWKDENCEDLYYYICEIPASENGSTTSAVPVSSTGSGSTTSAVAVSSTGSGSTTSAVAVSSTEVLNESENITLNSSLEIDIKFKYNCELLNVNPKNTFIAEAECPACTYVETDYSWTVEYFHSGRWYKLKDEETNTGFKNKEISLKYGLLEGTEFALTINVTFNGESRQKNLTFFTNSPPYGGNCTVEPNSGITLKTKFNISCYDWKASEIDNFTDPSHYHFYSRVAGSNSKNLLDNSVNSASKPVIIEAGHKQYNYTVELIIAIYGLHNSYYEYSTNITVLELISQDIKETLVNLTGPEDSLMNQLIEEGNVSEALSLAFIVGSLLNYDSEKEEISKESSIIDIETKILLRENILEDVAILSPSQTKVINIAQTASLVKVLTEEPGELSEAAQFNAAFALEKMASSLLNSWEMTTEDKLQISMELAYGGSNILSLIFEDKVVTPEESGINAVATLISTSLDTVSSAISQTLVVGQVVDMSTPSVQIKVRRALKSEYLTQTVTKFENEAVVKFPPANLLFSGENLYTPIDSKFLAYQGNPYLDDSRHLLNSKGLSVALQKINLINFPVNNLDSAFEFELPNIIKGESDKFEIFSNDQLDDETYFYIFSTQVVESESIIMKLSNVINCQLGYFIKIYVGNSTNESLVTDYLFNSSLPCVDANDIDQNYTYDLVISREYFQISGTYYIGIQLNGEIKMMMELLSARCQYWNESSQRYDPTGCSVLETSTREITHCSCNHLTTFVGGIVIYTPEIINWAKIDITDLKNNATVFSTIVVIFFLYFVTIYFAWKADRKDREKWKITILDNGDIQNPYYYVIVFTGAKSNAGTNSKVSLILAGKTGKSQIFCLNKKEDEKLFSRGSMNQFVIPVSNSIGSLNSVKIWHDSSAAWDKGSWYLSKIIVIDPQEEKGYTFLCEQWLALDQEDGKIERILRLASEEELKQIGSILPTNAYYNFTDSHLWFSVLSRPRKSNFNRVQRLSCCLCILCTSMIANCMFYQELASTSNDMVFAIGPLQFSWKAIYIGLISSVVVFPGNILIIQIFRKTKPYTGGRKGMCLLEKMTSELKQNKVVDLNNSEHKITECSQTVSSEILATECKKKMFNIVLENGSIKSGENAEKKQGHLEEGKKTKKKKAFLLPYCFVYLAWFLIAAACLASAACTVAYSLQWGSEDSKKWLVAFFVSFFEDVIIIQPIKVLAATLIATLIFKKYQGDDELASNNDQVYPSDENINFDNDWVNSEDNSLKLKELKELRKKEQKMWEIIKEIIFYTIFLALLWFIAYAERNHNSYYIHKSVKNMIIDNDEFKQMSGGFGEFYDWLDRVVIPTLYPNKYYNGDNLKEEEATIFADFSSFRLGPGRIRQFRVKNDTCTIPVQFSKLIKNCYGTYSTTNEETTNLSGNVYTKEQIYNNPSIYSDIIWQYNKAEDSELMKTNGVFHSYSQGGYTLELGNTAEEAENMVNYIRESSWLDRQTRAILVEFNLYHSNVDLFSSVTVILEHIRTGGGQTGYRIDVTRLTNLSGAFWFITVFFQISFLISFIYQTYKEIKNIITIKTQYFKCFWNVIEIMKIVACLIALVFFVLILIERNSSLNILGKSEGFGKYVNLRGIVFYEDIYRSILALVVFSSSLKLLHILRFYKKMALFSATLSAAAVDILNFLLIIAIVLLAYGQLMYIVFGPTLDNYNTLGSSLAAEFQTWISAAGYTELHQVSPILGPIIFLSFCFVVYIFLTLIFITIILLAFQKVKNYDDVIKNDFEILDFFIDTIKNMLGLRNFDKYEKTISN